MTTRSSIPTIIDNHGGSIIAALVASEQADVANLLGFISGAFLLTNNAKLETHSENHSAGAASPSREENQRSADQNSVEDGGEETSLIAQRLLRTGICKTTDDFELVIDTVSKEVLGRCEDDDATEVKGGPSTEAARVTHLNTGVWEVITFEQDGTANGSFYVVTAVSVRDRIDARKLRKAICKGRPFQRRPKIHWAPTPVAEALTGYKSGTMAPICHTTDMMLFLEESILQGDANQTIVSGSGISGKGLSLSSDKFLEIARLNPEGFEAVPLIQKKKNNDLAAAP